MSLLLCFDLYNYQMHSLKSKNAYTYITLHKGQSNSHAWNDRSQWVTSWCGAVQCGCDAVVKSFGQISPFGDESDFVLSHCVHVSSTKSGIYSSRWNFRRRRILRIIPRARATAKLSVVVVVVIAAFFANRTNGNKMSNFRGYLRRVVQKLWQCYVASSIYLPKKPIGTCRDILLRHTSRFHKYWCLKKSIKVMPNSLN